jgi:thiamine biosynthesis lipoprotein
MTTVRRSFRAMGSECTLHVEADSVERGCELVDSAVVLLADLERRWSRFRGDSELAVINASGGAPVLTSVVTAELVALALEAWRTTGGLFDPTVHDALVASGYDRSFEVLAISAGPPIAGAHPPVPGAGGIEVDVRSGRVVAPAGVHLDLGGIGKGRAADLVLAHLLAAGARGACVDLGGDVALAAPPDDGDGWVVVVDDPFAPGRDLAALRLVAGAVTTSATTRRRWEGAGGSAHHLIDPRTGRPAASGLVSLTVVAGSAAAGEVQAKAALIAGPARAPALLESAGMSGLLVHEDGRVGVAGHLDPFLVGGAPAVAPGPVR